MSRNHHQQQQQQQQTHRVTIRISAGTNSTNKSLAAEAATTVKNSARVDQNGSVDPTAGYVSVKKDAERNNADETDRMLLDAAEPSPATSRAPPAADCSDKSVFYELTRTMMRLYSVDKFDPRNESMLADLRYVQNCLEDRQKSALPARLVELGFLELAQHACRSVFFRQGHGDGRGSVFSDGGSLEMLSLVLGVAADLTDRSTSACQRVLLIEFQQDLFDMLRDDSLDPAKVKFAEWQCFMADCVMTVLYNVVQTVTEARELYRDQNAVHVFQRFRANTSDSVSCMSLILQSYVINEDENDLVGSDDRSFSFLADELHSAVTSSNGSSDVESAGRSDNGYRAVEILRAVDKLAVNDSNKAKIVASGALTSLVALLSPECSVDEQYLAAQGLWTLALSCAEDVRKAVGCVEGLQRLLKTSEVDGVRRQVRGVLETLGIIDETTTARQDNSTTAAAATAAGDGGGGGGPTQLMMCSVGSQGSSFSQPIFISYNHGSKATVLRLRDRLKSAGFMVWVDEEGVYESIADDIITGLEQASVVLVCMTQKYYESPYCKKEVVYAAESFKKIIPLTLEPRYNPHGWLRFHTSDGLRYDFSNEETFDESFRKLVQALRKVFESSSLRAAEKAKQSQQQQQQLTSTQQSSAGGHQEFLSQPSAPVVDAGLKSWTSAEVKNWLSSSGLQHLGHWFEGFDGEMLLEYKAYRQYSPETFASCVRDERENGRLTIADVMKLNKALKRL